MGGSESEVGHPNFQSLYGESNLRGILVGCPAPGGGVAYSRGGLGVNDKGLTLTGNVKGQAYRLTLSESGQRKAPPLARWGGVGLGYGSVLNRKQHPVVAT